MSLVVPAEVGAQNGVAWIPAFAGKTRVIQLKALIDAMTLRACLGSAHYRTSVPS